MSDRVILSIVIPTRNRADLLRKVLQSITMQKADPDLFEVLVIDNGSTDETRDVAKEYRGKFRHYRYFYDARPGLHVGRNRGIEESRGELIGYLDDDVILFPDWINAVLDAFRDEEVMRVSGSVIPYDMTLLTKEFCKKYETVVGAYHFVSCISCFWQTGVSEEDRRIEPAPLGAGFGADIVYRKRVLLECRGFHPDGMPNHLLMYRGDGETYVDQFLRTHHMKVLYCAQASVYHMIDVNRVSDSYIAYMYFRSGISEMYANLRKNGLRGGIRCLYEGCRVLRIKRRDTFQRLRGKLYLFAYYSCYERVRDWVHKEAYF